MACIHLRIEGGAVGIPEMLRLFMLAGVGGSVNSKNSTWPRRSCDKVIKTVSIPWDHHQVSHTAIPLIKCPQLLTLHPKSISQNENPPRFKTPHRHSYRSPSLREASYSRSKQHYTASQNSLAFMYEKHKMTALCSSTTGSREAPSSSLDYKEI